MHSIPEFNVFDALSIKSPVPGDLTALQVIEAFSRAIACVSLYKGQAGGTPALDSHGNPHPFPLHSQVVAAANFLLNGTLSTDTTSIVTNNTAICSDAFRWAIHTYTQAVGPHGTELIYNRTFFPEHRERGFDAVWPFRNQTAPHLGSGPSTSNPVTPSASNNNPVIKHEDE